MNGNVAHQTGRLRVGGSKIFYNGACNPSESERDGGIKGKQRDGESDTVVRWVHLMFHQGLMG